MNSDIIIKIILLVIIVGYYLYVVIYEKRSIRSNIIENGVKFSKYKTIVSNEQIFDKHIEKLLKNDSEDYSLPKYKFRCKIEVLKHNDMTYCIFNKNKKLKKIFYLHGGSYIENPLFFHYKFLDDLAKQMDIEIIMPIYPKAPKYNYKYSINLIYELYNKIFKDGDDVILMGDSAGGGFALVLSMMLRNNKCINPNKIILFSPWIDVTMKNKDIKSLEKVDPFLSKNALIKAGMLWAGNEDRNNWMISPINGEYKGLNEITIFIGTHELLLSDARKLKNVLKQENVVFNYYEYNNMNHDFPLFPIPEANDAKKKVIEIINE